MLVCSGSGLRAAGELCGGDRVTLGVAAAVRVRQGQRLVGGAAVIGRAALAAILLPQEQSQSGNTGHQRNDGKNLRVGCDQAAHLAHKARHGLADGANAGHGGAHQLAHAAGAGQPAGNLTNALDGGSGTVFDAAAKDTGHGPKGTLQPAAGIGLVDGSQRFLGPGRNGITLALAHLAPDELGHRLGNAGPILVLDGGNAVLDDAKDAAAQLALGPGQGLVNALLGGSD